MTRAFIHSRTTPSSVRYATAAIISTIVLLVVLGAVLMRIFAPEQYENFGEALWFTLQTVTTVGYGDETRRRWSVERLRRSSCSCRSA